MFLVCGRRKPTDMRGLRHCVGSVVSDLLELFYMENVNVGTPSLLKVISLDRECQWPGRLGEHELRFTAIGV